MLCKSKKSEGGKEAKNGRVARAGECSIKRI